VNEKGRALPGPSQTRLTAKRSPSPVREFTGSPVETRPALDGHQRLRHETESELAGRRVAAAMAWERSLAALHRRQFIAGAFAERPELRSDPQRAAVVLTRRGAT
jgi:hypothetical protein